ncbi:MAG: hypothetical protein FGM37_05015, partial [Phycisphaerales bacterium]|nr:hypothetical protein [Phycisphaerales bacterium]
MTGVPLEWPAVRACATAARQRAGRALVVSGWWTFGAIVLWVLSHLATGWVMDRIAPLPEPEQVAQAQDIATPLA